MDAKTLILLLTYSALAFTIIASALLVRHRKKLTPPYYWLGYFLLLNIIVQASSTVLAHFYMPNLFLLHILTLGEFILLSFFFKGLITKPHFIQKYFYWIIAIISILIVTNSAFLQPITGFNSYAKSLVQLIIMIYCVLYLYNLSDLEDLDAPMHPSLRLVISGIFVYYSGSLIIFMFSNFIIASKQLIMGFWVINALLYFLFQLVILIGVWRAVSRKMKSSF